MKALRFWFVTILGWFFLLYNVERLIAPINIASFVYIFTIAVAMLIILFPQLQKISLPWLFITPLLLFFGLKIWSGYPVGGRNLPITVTEICAVIITIVLARQVGRSLIEFEEAIIQVMTSNIKSLSRPFDVGQGAMYREVRRARTNQHPLAVLAISAPEVLPKLAIDRFIEEVQRDNIRRYVNARIAEFLSKEMKDYDIIAQRDNHFITLLSGVSHQDVREVVQKLENAAKENLGLTLKIGVATFPEEVTFEELVVSAEGDMTSRSTAVRDSQGEEIPSRIKMAL